MLEFLLPKFEFFRMYREHDLLKKLRSGFSDNSSGDYVEHLQYLIDDDLIIIDDFGSSGHTDWREEVMFEIIEFRNNYKKAKATIYTTNLNEEDFKEIYNARIASRLFAKKNCIIDFGELPDLRKEIG